MSGCKSWAIAVQRTKKIKVRTSFPSGPDMKPVPRGGAGADREAYWDELFLLKLLIIKIMGVSGIRYSHITAIAYRFFRRSLYFQL